MSDTNRRDGAGYTECFAAFIDLLGFRSLVKASEQNAETVATLVAALNRIGLETPSPTHLKARHSANGEIAGYDTWVVQVRPFSDCVCLFIPTEGGRLPWLLNSIRYIHDRMLELGGCIRGAVTIGGMYWERSWGSAMPTVQRQLRDWQFRVFGQEPPEEPAERTESDVLYEAGKAGFPITLGPALVEAYELERDVAIYPRVIASNKLRSWLNEHGNDSAFPLTLPTSGAKAQLPLSGFFRTGDDALPFLDLLHPDCARNDTERIVRTIEDDAAQVLRWERSGQTHKDVMANVDRVVQLALNQPDCPEKIRVKYEWLRSYAVRVRQE